MKHRSLPATALVAVLLVSACANTPTKIRALGALHTVESPVGWEQTAKCSIPRYDDEVGFAIVQNLRIYDDHAEIIGTGGKPVTVTDFLPVDTGGSVANIYATDDLIPFRSLVARRMADAVQGCADKLGAK